MENAPEAILSVVMTVLMLSIFIAKKKEEAATTKVETISPCVDFACSRKGSRIIPV